MTNRYLSDGESELEEEGEGENKSQIPNSQILKCGRKEEVVQQKVERPRQGGEGVLGIKEIEEKHGKYKFQFRIYNFQ